GGRKPAWPRRYDQVAGAADPQLAARQLERLVEAARRAEVASPLEALAGDEHLRRRLAAVLGASSALGDHLVAHPDQWRCLAEPGDPPAHGDVTDVAALRMSYRRNLLRIAADDLTGVRDVEETMATLSALADATL